MDQHDIPVEEFTTPNPITVHKDATIHQLTEIMKENHIRHLPVVEHNEVIGIISDRDLKLVSGLSAGEQSLIHAKDIMVRDPVTFSADESIEKVALEMSEQKIGSVIVNDENGQFLGIFTAIDALNALVEIVRTERTKYQ